MRNLIYLALTLAVAALSISQYGLGGSCHLHDGASFRCYK
jgi:hypothetical protein